ncbi:SNF2 domain-containing protein CLASSY 1-like [Macadamia integrifolia]|uniref:SNF2 domain-containing protein CLASSY 1-like n=1 Tax=Macadamia integrifolia TaxID=60698 RepID=UPI001C5026B4|nr:SNF2 domain-containing protein CLASSY 1-like [Macadamia integrifolia]XP_042497127.1 SNF2 domain-containing protein CLASSY 1-like [Macadamia integrifolia]XP_042497128.1 SNF2 domain-containing protein CLASSY 1-like [Macadamia integrifolia]
MAKRHLYRNRHPFDIHPFEAFSHGSWRTIEHIRIRDGTVAMRFETPGFEMDEEVYNGTVRVRSRKAILSDCDCFLRAGIDVCVLLTDPTKDKKFPQSVRIDARINSIERRPHEPQCTCRFNVTFHTTHRRNGKLCKGIRDVGIDDIAIIQRLQRKPCEDGYHRWSYSQDCPSAVESKLFRGQFSSDISWLLVTSIWKGLKFDLRSVQSKIVYQILYGDDHDVCSSDTANNVAINFQMDNGIIRPFTRTFIPVDTFVSGSSIEACPVHDLQEDDSLQLYDPMELRRSKRRNVQPERFVSYRGFSKPKPSIVETEEDKINGWKENRTLSIILHQADNVHLMHSESFRRSIGGEMIIEDCNGENMIEDSAGENFVEYSMCENMVEDSEVYYRKKSPVNQSNVKSRDFMSGADTRMKNKILLLENHEMDGGTAAPYGRPKADNGLFSGDSHFSFPVYASRKNKRKLKSPISNCTVSTPRVSSDIPLTSESVSLLHPQDYPPIQIIGNPQKMVSWVFSEHSHRHGSSVMGEKTLLRKRFEEMQEKRCRKMEVTWKVKGSNKKHLRRVSNLFCSKRDRSGETRTRRNAFLSTSEYKKMIDRFMKNIESEIKREHPHAAAQWEAMRGMNCSNQRWRDKCTPVLNDQTENSELELLWKEMEFSMATVNFIGDSQGSRLDTCDEVAKKSSKDYGHSCHHEFKMDEEVGLVCKLCSFVSTEIRDVSLPFFQNTGWIAKKYLHDEELRWATAGHEGQDIFGNPGSSEEIPLSKRSDNVWAMIPELRMKLHSHQKKAFEFLWKNIVGSLIPAEMEQCSKRTGGCVISHSPGAGKTLVIIAFLESYLKMFPGKRPLILAPKTTLYTWYKEMKKWDVSFPVYQIHVRANFRHGILNHEVEEPVGDRRPNLFDQHVMDCLEKIQKWHEHPSILLMGYTSFLTLTRDGSKYEHRRYIGRILKRSPGILVLDEGHNPRSTKSRLRKALMKVKTDLRILLSGTLFQNNFSEYFNTLCLARPVFVYEVLRKLNPNTKYRKERKCYNSMETLARRFFTEKIAKKIKSKLVEERRRGLSRLRKITKGFIDVYEGGVQDSLPGLQSYTLLMKSTVIQQDLQTRLQNQKVAYKGYPLELELLITLGSIHPWLITTVACADKYFTMEELQDLKKHRLDLKKGSKVRFVVSLVQKCIMKMEKVLIFAHNIAPISLFVEIFEMIFGWQMGEEILVLQGDQELYERARVMDKFEESDGPSRVLLASITACAEGISLTAASRVVLLDSEWNPSKTKQAIARAFRPGQERIVYVYQLLASGSLEEEKYGKTTWKEWVSSMIFSEAIVDDSSHKQVENIDDDVLREIVEDDQAELFHTIMKHDKLSNGLDRGKAAEIFLGK